VLTPVHPAAPGKSRAIRGESVPVDATATGVPVDTYKWRGIRDQDSAWRAKGPTARLLCV
jgi:hypothetical protein